MFVCHLSGLLLIHVVLSQHFFFPDTKYLIVFVCGLTITKKKKSSRHVQNVKEMRETKTDEQSATALSKRKTTKCNVNLETTLWCAVYRMCHWHLGHILHISYKTYGYLNAQQIFQYIAKLIFTWFRQFFFFSSLNLPFSSLLFTNHFFVVICVVDELNRWFGFIFKREKKQLKHNPYSVFADQYIEANVLTFKSSIIVRQKKFVCLNIVLSLNAFSMYK